MSNPWAQSFEELRSPYLQEKMAKKDYDGDGKIETGTQEYKGSVDKAIKKAMGKKAEGKKKVAEHHQKDANGNTIPHEDEGDGTPSSVEEMVDKKFGSSDKVNLEKAVKNIQQGNVKKIDKKVKKLSDEYTAEAKIDKIDPKNKRNRRNVAKFGPQTKPYDPPTKEMKTSMGKFMQKTRQDMHKKKRGVKQEEVVLESDKKGKGSGTKDACYHKVKSRYSVWPSAYASGALVKCRKAGAKNWGNSSKKEEYEYVDETYKGKHGQSEKEYAASRSQGGKMISGDDKMSGAEYTHGRRVKAENPGMQPDVGGKTKPKSQGKMDKGTRADLEYRKANLKKEEVENVDEACWKGYEKKGMKTMFGKRYPNCVKKEDVEYVGEDRKSGQYGGKTGNYGYSSPEDEKKQTDEVKRLNKIALDKRRAKKEEVEYVQEVAPLIAAAAGKLAGGLAAKGAAAGAAKAGGGIAKAASSKLGQKAIQGGANYVGGKVEDKLRDKDD